MGMCNMKDTKMVRTLSAHSTSSRAMKRKQAEKEEKTDDIGVDSLTIHGLPRAVNSSSWACRAFWGILFMLGFYIFVRFASDRVRAFFHHDVLQSVRILSESEPDFPSVTICNMRKLELKARQPKFSEEYPNEHKDPNEALDKHFKNITDIHRHASFDEFTHGYGKIANSTSKFCRYGNGLEPCDKSLFRTVSLMPGCLTFNPDGNLKQEDAGFQYGLQLLLYMNISDSVLEAHDDGERSIFPGSGADDFVVIVHEPKTFPDLTTRNAIIAIGHHTKIALHKRVSKRLPPPFPSKCVHSMPGRRYNMFPGKYQHPLCIRSCELYRTYLKCGEFPEYFRRVFSYEEMPIFLNHSDHLPSCMEESRKLYNRDEDNPESCHCPFPCDTISYDFMISTTRWPLTEARDKMADFLSKNMGVKIKGDEMEKQFAYLSVFYDDLYYIEETEVPKYDINSLLSDIGGQAGLYLGASLISIIELSYLMIFSLGIHLKKFFSGEYMREHHRKVNEDYERGIKQCLNS